MAAMHKRNIFLLFLLGWITVGVSSGLLSTEPVHAALDMIVYADTLAPGWQDWSWDTTRNLSDLDPKHGGTASISVAFTEAWGALYLHTDSALNGSDYTALRFWIHGGAHGGQDIAVKVIDGSNTNWDNFFAVTPQANAWTEVTVSLAQVGNPATITGLVWQDSRGSAQPAFTLDDVILVGKTGQPPGNAVSLTIDAAADPHPISPLVYGMNFAGEDLADELRLPVRRMGGNSTTRYNWQIDVHNTGSDWYFENIPDENSHPELLPDGSSADRIVEQDRRTGTESMLTVPLIGWTPKRRTTGHPYDCGFPAGRFPNQQSWDPWDEGCGNGKNPSGSNLTGNDPQDTSTQIGPDFVKAWIAHLSGKYGKAAAGGVQFYSLDNEPMLWPYTHRDVHPAMTTYNEIRDRTYTYAAAVKQADPTAQTLGPVVWGWCAYFYSAMDGCTPGADHASHGNTDFIPWYLQQMRAYEQAHGIRILDYLDVHIYPQGEAVFSDTPGSAATQALRLRSTRALWDPTYRDESWIGQPVRLIPRLRAWVEDNYPGTKLAITEYNWGALGHLNGALAQADILGIFGREGLDLATLWAPPGPDDPGAFAFRMYRNYDGQGGAFGGMSVLASSTDGERLSVYAARRSDGALTVMVINKTGETLASSVSLANFSPALRAPVYRYSAANLNAVVSLPEQPVGPAGFSASFPASSITLFVIPLAEGSFAPLYLPLLN
jgi:hypothetical protein